MRAHPGLLAGFIIISIFMVISVAVFISGLFGARITPYDPIKLFVGPYLSPPSWSHQIRSRGRKVARTTAFVVHDFSAS